MTYPVAKPLISSFPSLQNHSRVGLVPATHPATLKWVSARVVGVPVTGNRTTQCSRGRLRASSNQNPQIKPRISVCGVRICRSSCWLLCSASLQIARAENERVRGKREADGREQWANVKGESFVSVSGEWFVCFCRPFRDGLQTNRVPLFDSVRSSGTTRRHAAAFPSRMYRPRPTRHVREILYWTWTLILNKTRNESGHFRHSRQIFKCYNYVWSFRKH